ncbi:Amino acid transporter, transmembrane domain [Sesbania bispinosa]|nr:Amino acid transporter, transmembrane domain [Sesbania bispinosa]
MNKHPQIKSYSDIGNVAFGYKGRVVVAIFMYLDLYLVAVELLTLGGDSLQYMFPNMNFKIATLSIKGDIGFILLTALAILPTTWLRSLGALAYISASGALVYLILMWCVLWAGAVDGVGFYEKGQLMNLRGFPAALSLFNFCYSAHAVFPTLSYSMRDKRQFDKVLLFCFVTSTTGYGLMSIIAIYTSLFVPFTKYAIMVTPIAIAIEDKLRSNSRFSSVLIRTMIVVLQWHCCCLACVT